MLGGESLSSKVIGENFGQNSGFLNNGNFFSRQYFLSYCNLNLNSILIFACITVEGNMDFSSSYWMSSMVDGQTVTRIVDGNVFTILFSGNVVYINGFPVTADQWNQALNGLEVKLSFQGKQATLSSIGSNVMFNGKSMTNGSTMSSHSSFGSTSSLNTNILGTGNGIQESNKQIYNRWRQADFRFFILRPNLKNLSRRLNLSCSSNIVGST